MATSTGLNSKSLYNNIDYLRLQKPSKARNAYKDLLTNYDRITMFINMMNPAGSIREDNFKYDFFTSTGLYTPLYASSNSTLLPNKNLEVNVALPAGVTDLRETIRETNILSDGNNKQGRVVKVNTTSVELEISGATTSWDAATDFTSNTSVTIEGNAQPFISGGISSLHTIPTEDFNYHQISRDGHQFGRNEIIQPTWATYGEKTWQNYDITRAAYRVFKDIARTDYYGQRSLTGSGSNRVYRSRGIRESIIQRNPELYFPLSSVLNETKLREMITKYRALTGGVVTELICCTGSYQLANIQSFMSQYIVTAGNTNTFGGMDVSGLNIVMYNFCGIKIMFEIAGIFDDPIKGQISQITQEPKESGNMFFFTNKKVEKVNGLAPSITIKHAGPKEIQATFLRGMVEKELLEGHDLSGITLEGGMPVTSLTDGATFGVYSTRSLEIDPKYMMLAEYIN